MSFNTKLDELILGYIRKIFSECDIRDKKNNAQVTVEDLLKIWNGEDIKVNFSDEEEALAYYSKRKVPELKRDCEELDLVDGQGEKILRSSKGRKYQLITYLLQHHGHDVDQDAVKSRTTRKKKKSTKKSTGAVFKRLKEFEGGTYFVHSETNFVCTNKEEGIVGKIDESGSEMKVVALSREDFLLAKQWNLTVMNAEHYEN